MAQPDMKELDPSSMHVDHPTATDSGFAIHAEQERTAEEKKVEKKLLLKIDLLILPLLALVYFLASMDRGDVGNAAVAGMSRDLNLTGSQLASCISLFYVGYIVFQLPGDLFLRKLTPPIQIGMAMVTWGLLTTLISVSKNYATVVVLRVLIGGAEAFVQAAPLYLSLWYKRDQLTSRAAVFFSMTALAGSMNGLIAYGIETSLDGARGLAAWKWIFLVEGPITIACGLIVMVILPPVPEKIKFGFSQAEREMAVRRSQEAFNTTHAKIKPKQLFALVKDPKTYLYSVLYCCTNVNLAAVGGFMPLIIRSLGYKSLHAQILTIPVFACAWVSIMVFGFASDRLKLRGVFLMVAYVITAVGWIILLAAGLEHKHLAFGGTFVVAIGTYPSVILNLGWMNSNVIGFTKRAGSLAVMNMFGQAFAIAGSMVFDTPPKYVKGKVFALCFSVVGAVVTVVLIAYLHFENAKKRRDQHSEEANSNRRLGLEEIFEKHPDFYYWL